MTICYVSALGPPTVLPVFIIYTHHQLLAKTPFCTQPFCTNSERETESMYKVWFLISQSATEILPPLWLCSQI